jgi:hypothetical protein
MGLFSGLKIILYLPVCRSACIFLQIFSDMLGVPLSSVLLEVKIVFFGTVQVIAKGE